jgi:prolyl-tRNA synthetase
LCRRDNRAKETVDLADLVSAVGGMLDTIQVDMFNKAKAIKEESIAKISEWAEFVPSLNQKKICLVPWCNRTPCEEVIKTKSGEESVAAAAADPSSAKLSGAAKSLCIPLEQDQMVPGTKCFSCGEDAVCHALFGRSY